jgi:putative ABC transport system permease protein
MSWLDGLRHRVRTVCRPGDFDRGLDEEFRLHQELDALQRGDDARAGRRFGNRTYHKEEARNMTWLAHLDVLRQDASYAWRSIRRTPGVTLLVSVTLALGFGVNAATFSVLDRMYFRPPTGVVRPQEIRRLWFETSAQRSYSGKSFVSSGTSYPVYHAIARASRDPKRFALYTTDYALSLRRSGTKIRVRGNFASASYFGVLGVRPALGRLYSASEDSLGQGSNVVVIGHRFWATELGGDSAILGTKVEIEHTQYTIVGVLPPNFTGLEMQAADVWIPLASLPASHWLGRNKWWEGDRANGFAAIYRPAESGSDAAFESRATAVLRDENRRLSPKFPDTLANVLSGPLFGTGSPGKAGQDTIIANRLGAVAVIILLIACANVINLLLARAEVRKREIAVRLALGVSRTRLVRLLTTETVILALLAGGAAVLAAWWGGTALRAALFRNVTWYESALHWRVIVYAIGLALFAGLIAGLIPAIRASNPQLTKSLKDGVREGRRRSRLRSALVAAQAALSVVLLVGAALFVKSLENVRSLDLGFDSDRLVFGRVSFEPDQQKPAAVVAAEMSQIADRLSGRPGVEAVARSRLTPMQGFSFMNFFWDADSAASLRPNTPTYLAVSPEFFRASGVRVLRGTPFVDGEGAPRQVVINQAMARRLWPGGEAIGRCIHFETREAACYTVVGVAENSRQGYVIEKEAVGQFYLPLVNHPGKPVAATTLLVRARGDAVQPVRQELTAALTTAFPGAEAKVTTMMENLEPEYWPWRLGASLFTGFGLLALLVAMIGIYSSVSFGVTQRWHEFGVRIALGAQMADVLAQVVQEGLRVVAVGVGAGVALALATGKLVSSLLYDVQPSNPAVMLGVSAVLLAVAALAALVPAWRAARVNPIESLRAD